jgi:hypothetical protein
VRIDHTHRNWLIASLVVLVVSTITYLAYAWPSPAGPRGGSAIGLTFGIAGFAFMMFAGLLGARKKVPVWRLGRAQTWMRGHLWLGLLSLPLILFHGGFHFGGTLTRILMWLLIVVVASGVLGAVLQHYLPQVMTDSVPLETIYDEIASVRAQLLEEADEYVAALCGPLNVERETPVSSQRAGGFAPAKASGAAVAASAVAKVLTEEEALPLRRFYLEEMRVFLAKPVARGHRLADAGQARGAFANLKTLFPPAAHGTLEDLEAICEEARQLERQARLHRWLHGWLLVHVPLSFALLALGAVHAVMALRF